MCELLRHGQARGAIKATLVAAYGRAVAPQLVADDGPAIDVAIHRRTELRPVECRRPLETRR